MFNRIGYRNTYGIITSNNRMVNYYWSSSNSCGLHMASMLRGRYIEMTIVVKKVPKALRGIVKFIFKIKD